MDSTDTHILNLLKENARYDFNDIALQLNLSLDDVKNRINALKHSGIIRKFTTIINDTNLKEVPTKALIELSISPQKNTGYDAIAQRIYEYPNVVSHYLVSGQYDFLLVVEGKDHKDIAHFVFDKLATLDHVKSTTTHFIFKSYKEHHVLLEDSELKTRIPIMP